MRQIAVILLCLNLMGCTALQQAGEFVTGLSDYFLGGEDNTEPPAELVEYQPEISIEQLWKEEIGVGFDEQYVKLVLAINDDVIYAADREGLVAARELQTGKLIWDVETALTISAGPGIGNESIILGTSNAEVIALNSATGETIWHTRVSSEVLSVPKITQGIVLIRTVDGRMFALDELNGDPLWQFERNVPPLSIRGTGAPIMVDDVIISGYANGKIYSLLLSNGKQVWETSVAIPQGRSEVERLVDLDADPVETDGVVYIASYQGGTSAVLTGDGDVLWRVEEISSSVGLNNDDRYLYVTDTASDVWQLDQRNGAALWKQKELHQRRLTAPVVYENYIIVGDIEGYVHWLSDEDGRQLGRKQISDSAIIAKPVVVDDVVYVYASDGTLAALTAQVLAQQPDSQE